MKAQFPKVSFIKKITSTILLSIIPASAVQAASDPVIECRAAHAADPVAHIACLETALNEAGRTMQSMRSESVADTDSTAGRSSGLGSEQVQQKKRVSGELAAPTESVSILDARYNAAGLGVFKLDNGQVWRETVAAPHHLQLKPGQPYLATIERGSVGGYRMQVDGIRRQLKVERLQ